MWIGVPLRDKTLLERQVSLTWCNELKILGVTFENDLRKTIETYEEKINDIEREIGKWMHRNISLRGKVTVIKSLLLSKISYLILSLPSPPQTFVNRLTKVLHNFLWHGKNEKIVEKR